jgi:hypothetical protein
MTTTSVAFGLLFDTQQVAVDGLLNVTERNEKMKAKATTIGKWYEKDTFKAMEAEKKPNKRC